MLDENKCFSHSQSVSLSFFCNSILLAMICMTYKWSTCFPSVLGRFDLSHVLYRCLGCTKDLSTTDPIITAQLGFWPGSIANTTFVFDQELFLHWNLFQKQSPGTSERSFLKSLEQFSVRKGRVCTLHKCVSYYELLLFFFFHKLASYSKLFHSFFSETLTCMFSYNT